MLFSAIAEKRNALFSGLDTPLDLVGRALGLEKSDDTGALCDLYAAPFIHGPALAPELRRLQDRFDQMPEESELRTAHAQIHQMLESQPAASEALEALQDDFSCTDDLAGMVETQLEREKELESRRVRATESARREAEEDRPAFEAALAERMEAADLSSESLAREADMLTAERMRSMANSVIGEIQSVSQAWQEFIR